MFTLNEFLTDEDKMAIGVGDKLPAGEFTLLGAEGPTSLSVEEISKGKKIIVFGLPGAYTSTCTTQHMPSFVERADELRAKGVDGIYCLATNDVFVMQSWAEETGATGADITMLSDGSSDFIRAIGLEFSAPPVGFVDRCKRFAAIVEDGTVTAIGIDENPGECSLSSGLSILDQL